ncbi:hypothetical protein BS50DRAFT_568490 [Corynespora cassiicola Philippines]|uniref:Uncharacterized protein n=1 Tax=Corynespora cassiicola Philippines TaxID=1448308 RepID=A0A2T2P6C3_CORCC|nr:hypothetical protein BS50DRAFT_568490 [Corynespora cassiicola Philippines]
MMNWIVYSVAIIFAILVGVQAVPSATRTVLPGAYGLDFLNLTSLSDEGALGRSSDHDYFIFFYDAEDCAGNLIDGFGGKGRHSCRPIDMRARSIGWLPFYSERTIRVSTADTCLGLGQRYGPEKAGCQEFPDILKAGVMGFEIY